MSLFTQWVTRKLSRRIRPFLQTFGLMQTSKWSQWSLRVWEPQGKRVIVFAPHFDDETIGCGGAIARHTTGGAEVTAVFMTCGRAGDRTIREMTGPQREQSELALMKVRKQEAEQATDLLGVRERIFLDATETQLMATPDLTEKVRHLIRSIDPDVVYLPFFLDEHPDHVATNQIVMDAVSDLSASERRFNCMGYEVWTALCPNCLVTIDETVDTKRKALQHYTSQLTQKDYIHTSLGLNAYRSIALLDRRCAYAEAYVMMGFDDYRQLFEAYKTCAAL